MRDDKILYIIALICIAIIFGIAIYSTTKISYNKGRKQNTNCDSLAIEHFRMGYAYGSTAFLRQGKDSTLYDMWVHDSTQYEKLLKSIYDQSN